MLIQGIKRGRTIELLEDLDIADGPITIEVSSFFAGELQSLSVGESQPKPGNFSEAMVEWREEYGVEELDIDPDEIWGDVRDRSPGREFSWDE